MPDFTSWIDTRPAILSWSISFGWFGGVSCLSLFILPCIISPGISSSPLSSSTFEHFYDLHVAYCRPFPFSFTFSFSFSFSFAIYFLFFIVSVYLSTCLFSVFFLIYLFPCWLELEECTIERCTTNAPWAGTRLCCFCCARSRPWIYSSFSTVLLGLDFCRTSVCEYLLVIQIPSLLCSYVIINGRTF
ncbi:hypothetical protein BCR34DRAFT_329129 [Clohesyomyces aquaticus]|uniref:Uncharacterized protein n=1 Tax=Clohesyomyces aquaticus TaxID=1231657 RepID=A0A1Y1ZLT6_9PLEO|nr:hypothetical protein BCR34DRAFT_329129 [Clohesyomyces aquaticus]